MSPEASAEVWPRLFHICGSIPVEAGDLMPPGTWRVPCFQRSAMPSLYKKPTRKQLIVGIVVVLAVVTTVGLAVVGYVYRPAALKGRIAALLSEQLESEVTIGSLEGTFLPRVALTGATLVVRHKGRTDVPPLLAIEHFEIRASVLELLIRRHVSDVQLRGLKVSISREDDADDKDKGAAPGGGAAAKKFQFHDFIIDRFEAPDTVLTLIPRNPEKQPKIFTIQHLVMVNVGRLYAVPYIAVLTNPIPKGQIEASGSFGPWNADNPARSAVTGKYVFANADLNTINGLSGVLSSEGSFQGPLNRIQVKGTTDTPKFQVDAGGQAVPLKTTFTAVVDGSDGDTILEQVDATFLNTALTAKGKVVGLEGVQGRQVEVTVHVDKGRIEDMLTMAVDSPKPLLRGALNLDANLVIPPRKAKVLDKMSLRGSFGLSEAKFADPSVQTKVTGLSRHGQGLKNEEPLDDVMSNMRGKFVIENAMATFPALRFGVPGAAVELAGSYGLRTQDINFHGHLVLDATVSQAAGGGFKSFLLKAVDPFFKKNGAGTVLPIKITGNKSAPKFGVDFFRKK
jgi:AsmA-like C-terminal region